MVFCFRKKKNNNNKENDLETLQQVGFFKRKRHEGAEQEPLNGTHSGHLQKGDEALWEEEEEKEEEEEEEEEEPKKQKKTKDSRARQNKTIAPKTTTTNNNQPETQHRYLINELKQ